jgi:hypothetical protein
MRQLQINHLAWLLLVGCWVSMASSHAHGQHCAPILESYLESISLTTHDAALHWKLAYRKSGGRNKQRYQGYLLGYLDRDADTIPATQADVFIDPDKVVVLHTAMMERGQDGAFRLEHEIDFDAFAEKIVSHFHLSEADRYRIGGWDEYRNEVRIALFIPFLEDTKYSTLGGLPEDKHECNYSVARALLFQALPYSLEIRLGVAPVNKQRGGRHSVLVHSDQAKRILRKPGK